MEILSIFSFMLDAVGRFFLVLDSMVLSFGGVSVSLLDIIIAYLIVCIITFAFWKGAKS